MHNNGNIIHSREFEVVIFSFIIEGVETQTVF